MTNCGILQYAQKVPGICKQNKFVLTFWQIFSFKTHIWSTLAPIIHLVFWQAEAGILFYDRLKSFSMRSGNFIHTRESKKVELGVNLNEYSSCTKIFTLS